MTTGSPPSITATTELVVPRSMPITLSAISVSPGVQPMRLLPFFGRPIGGAYSAPHRSEASKGPCFSAITAGFRDEQAAESCQLAQEGWGCHLGAPIAIRASKEP